MSSAGEEFYRWLTTLLPVLRALFELGTGKDVVIKALKATLAATRAAHDVELRAKRR